MKASKRAKRMEKHHLRNKASGLNLVSLMDIFTILVFFLLVSSSSVQQLPKKKDIRLPTSVAKKVPTETVVIMVSKNNILVQGMITFALWMGTFIHDGYIDQLFCRY